MTIVIKHPGVVIAINSAFKSACIHRVVTKQAVTALVQYPISVVHTLAGPPWIVTLVLLLGKLKKKKKKHFDGLTHCFLTG